MFFCLFLSIFLLCPPVLHADNASSNLTTLDTSWEYAWPSSPDDITAAWHPADIPGIPPGRNSRELLFLRTVLPTTGPGTEYFFLPRVYLVFDCFIEGEPVYSYGNMDTEGTIFKGLPWHMVPVPPGDEDRSLELHIRSDYSLIGILHEPVLGPEAAHLHAILSKDLFRLIVSLLFMLTGVLSLLLIHTRRRTMMFLGFALINLGAAFHTMYYSDVKQMLLDMPMLWHYLWMFSTSGMIIGGLVFMEDFIVPGPWKILRRLWQIHVLYVVLLAVFFLSGMLQASSVFTTARLVLYAAEACIIIPILVRAILRDEPGSKPILLGSAVFVLFMSVDLLTALRVLPFYRFNTHWGLLVFTAFLGYAIMRRMLEIQKIAARYPADIQKARARERDRVYADIHDHLGSRLSDIKILLERIGEERCKEIPELELLKKNSTEALAILRDRIADLDDYAAMDREFLYGLHLSLLRRYTGAGRILHFSTDERLSTFLNAPEYSHVAEIVRIVSREIVTNDLKYGRGPSSWSLAFEVGMPPQLILEMEAGTVFTQPSEGHGESIIKNRIDERGGIYEAERIHDRFRLQIRLPLKRIDREKLGYAVYLYERRSM